MNTIAGLVELARKLVQFVEWAVKYLGETIRRKRLEEIEQAHEEAGRAQTKQEKIDAAKRLEDSLNLRPPSRRP